MDFIKRHKVKLVLLGVFLLVFIVALFVLINLFYPDSRKDVYGNRLSGIENKKVSNQAITEIKDKISSSDFVDGIEYSLKGRLINFQIEVKSSTKVSEAKKLVSNIIESFDNDTKKFYDIQVIIIENDEQSKNYPVFAYKHKTNDKFVWTNN